MSVRYSFIVPVYNIEVYIRQCVESILSQKTNDYEILLVDDSGSVDASGSICAEYSEQYSNVYYYTSPSCGPSAARNYGVERMNGEYIIFVDGDDFISENTTLIYNKTIETYGFVDCICDNYKYLCQNELIFYAEQFAYDYHQFQNISGREAFVAITGESSLPMWEPYAKCFRRDFWEQNAFQFNEEILGEDFDLIYKAIYKAKSFVMVEPTYYYRVGRPGSSMNNPERTMKRLQSDFIIFDHWIHFAQENDFTSAEINGLNHIMAMAFRENFLSLYGKLGKSFAKQIRNEGEKYAYLIDSLSGKRNLPVKIVYHCLGLKMCSKYLILQKKILKK